MAFQPPFGGVKVRFLFSIEKEKMPF